MGFNRAPIPQPEQPLQPGTVPIRHKNGTKYYTTVAYRIKQFWDDPAHADWSVRTIILHRDEFCVVMKCELLDNAMRVRSTGHAEEYRGSSDVNSTSAVENAETSAIGRALAALGLGGEYFASAEEVQSAVQQQDQLKAIRDKYLPRFKEAASYGFDAFSDFYEHPKGDEDDNYTVADIRRSVIKDMEELKQIAEDADARAVESLNGQGREDHEEH